MHYVLAANCLIFFVLFCVWTTKNWYNLFIKMILFGLLIANGFELFLSLGFILKP